METLNGSVAAFAGVASVAAAVFSVHSQIEANADQARIERSFILYEHFMTSDAVNDLVTHSGYIEQELKALAKVAPVEDVKTLSAEINAREAGREFYDRMTELLRQSSAIARCAGYDKVDDGWLMTTMRNDLCDRSTVAELLREPIVDLFFMLRPMIYCDPYIEAFDRDIVLMEAIVTAHFQEGGLKVYQTVEESAAAAEDENYVVLEFGPHEHCSPFEGESQTVALPQTARSG